MGTSAVGLELAEAHDALVLGTVLIDRLADHVVGRRRLAHAGRLDSLGPGTVLLGDALGILATRAVIGRLLTPAPRIGSPTAFSHGSLSSCGEVVSAAGAKVYCSEPNLSSRALFFPSFCSILLVI